MKLSLEDDAIWVCSAPVDFRKSIDGLCSYVCEQFDDNPQAGLFVFYNRARDKVKILGWHRNGFVMVYKRLEAGKFYLARNTQDLITLDKQQLSWLIAGLDWAQMCLWDELDYDDFS